ncbi:Suppressor of cytokine signaling 6 [Desmophyllum pertusum]|uniref:Suppressor of cytokine signaling 6 n=1 Tax=Desmophyllum pertusum TaxID=174260 RepID=A0A9W9Z6C6_9CNID|nr:Suppressor of cytokine signaling 6 [Desmophyllum pertusum]
MEETEKEDEEQIYDHIEDEDTEEEKLNRNVEFISRGRSTAVGKESCSGTTANASGTTESTGEKKNLLKKLRKKFRSRKSSEDLALSHFGSHEESLPAYSSIEDEPCDAATATKRLSLQNMHSKTFSLPGFVKDRSIGASQPHRSRSKTFTSGIAKVANTGEDMFVPHADACSCPTHSPNTSCQIDAHAEEAPPPIPPHYSTARKEQWRQRAKSLTLSFDEDAVNGKRINMGKQSKNADDASYDYAKCHSATFATDLKSIETLSQYNWYWGPLNRYEAEDKLKGRPDGSFLVRDSCNEFYLYSVSFRSRGRTCHTRIQYEDGRFAFLTPPGEMGTRTVAELMKRSMKISQKGALCFTKAGWLHDTPHPIRFIMPVSRFEDLPSLQHLCRFVIRQNSRYDKLHELPLPAKIINYLNVENHFLENK